MTLKRGPFGFGWSLALPAITRKTDKGLPQYIDSQESDIFILSGAEDLMLVAEAKDIAKQFAGVASTSLRPEHVLGLIFSPAAQSEASNYV